MASPNQIHRGGRPKGSKTKATLEKEAVMKVLRQKILRSATPLYLAQMSLAKGLSLLYMQKTTKQGIKLKPELVTDMNTIEAFLNDELNENGDSEYYYITTERPDNRAIDSMFDRVFGKAMQTTEVSGKDGGPIVFVPMELMSKYKLNANDSNSSSKSNSK